MKLHSIRFILPLTILALLLGILAARQFIPIGDDWRASFYGLPILHPYSYNATRPFWARFYNPPWTVLLLLHSQLDIRTGNAINFLLNLVVPMAVIVKMTQRGESAFEYRKHVYTAAFLTFTSPFYLQLVATNNIEWIPLVGFLVPEVYSGIFLLCKPQAVGGALLIFAKRTRGRVLIPIIVVVALSLVIWPGWLTEIRSPAMNAVFNIAPFPLMIPLGLYLLWRAWKEDDEVLAACATPFLVPYMTLYAATSNMVLVSARYQKVAWFIWLAAWSLVAITLRSSFL